MSIPTVTELNQKIKQHLRVSDGKIYGLIDEVYSSSEATADHFFLVAEHYREFGHRSHSAVSRLVAMEDATNEHLSFICRAHFRKASLAAERLCSRIEDELGAIVDVDPMLIVSRFPDILAKIAEHHSGLLQSAANDQG